MFLVLYFFFVSFGTTGDGTEGLTRARWAAHRCAIAKL